MAVLVGLWHALPQLARVLFVLMLVDVALSIAIAIRDGGGWDQVRAVASKRAGYTLIVGLAAYLNPQLEPALGINLAQAASSFYIVEVVASVGQKSGHLGVPIPPLLQQAIATITKHK